METLEAMLDTIQVEHTADMDEFDPYDEWGEAACFRHCQKIATKAIEDTQSNESNDALA